MLMPPAACRCNRRQLSAHLPPILQAMTKSQRREMPRDAFRIAPVARTSPPQPKAARKKLANVPMLDGSEKMSQTFFRKERPFSQPVNWGKNPAGQSRAGDLAGAMIGPAGLFGVQECCASPRTLPC